MQLQISIIRLCAHRPRKEKEACRGMGRGREFQEIQVKISGSREFQDGRNFSLKIQSGISVRNEVKKSVRKEGRRGGRKDDGLVSVGMNMGTNQEREEKKSCIW